MVNYLPVLAAAVAAFAAGGVWYGPLFGKAYRKAMGIPEGKMGVTGARISPSQAMFLRFLATVVIVFVLSNLYSLLNLTTLNEEVMVAFVIWLGFIATINVGIVIFAGKPIKLYLINIGNELLGLLVATLVLFYWPW